VTGAVLDALPPMPADAQPVILPGLLHALGITRRPDPGIDRRLVLAGAANAGVTPEDAVADAINEAWLLQPVLRTCLVPSCLRQYDAQFGAGHPARPEWASTGWHMVTRGPVPGDVCPDHVNTVTAHLPRSTEQDGPRWGIACACSWKSTAHTWRGVSRSLWEEHLLQVLGQLPIHCEENAR
jgi:hypothetical protein